MRDKQTKSKTGKGRTNKTPASAGTVFRAVAHKAVRTKPRKSAAKARKMRRAKFALGDVVRHRIYPFRGVIFDIDPVFNNTEEWWLSIPENVRPRKDQPFYHLLAENEETEYIAYVSEQNLQFDRSGEPLRHPRISEYFTEDEAGRLHAVQVQAH